MSTLNAAYHGALKLIAATQTPDVNVLTGVALGALKAEHFEVDDLAVVLAQIVDADDAESARAMAREALEAHHDQL